MLYHTWTVQYYPYKTIYPMQKKSLIDVPTCHRFFVHLGIVFHFIFIVVDANVWEENKSKIENNDNGIEVKSSPI